MGLFLVIAGVWTFFGPVTLEKATDGATKELTYAGYVEALQPIEPVDYSKLNGD